MSIDKGWRLSDGRLVRVLYPEGITAERFELAVARIEEYAIKVLRDGSEREKSDLRRMLNDLHVALNEGRP